MPTIQVTILQDDLDQNQKPQLIKRLTESVSKFYITEKDGQVKEFVNIQIHETAENGYDVLQITGLSDPLAGSNQIRVRIKAAGVQPANSYVRNEKVVLLMD